MSHICKKCHTSLLSKQDWSVPVGLLIMSERELNHIEVLSQVTQGRMTAVTVANTRPNSMSLSCPPKRRIDNPVMMLRGGAVTPRASVWQGARFMLAKYGDLLKV